MRHKRNFASVQIYEHVDQRNQIVSSTQTYLFECILATEGKITLEWLSAVFDVFLFFLESLIFLGAFVNNLINILQKGRCQTKINEFKHMIFLVGSILTNANVVRLQVIVDEASRVELLKKCDDLNSNLTDCSKRKVFFVLDLVEFKSITKP